MRLGPVLSELDNPLGRHVPNCQARSSWLCAAWVDPDCAVITPTDANPVSSRATGLTQINKRIMPYCIIMLCGNVVCMMGAESGYSGFYSATNPQLQVDLLNTTATPLRFVTGEQTPAGVLHKPLLQAVASSAPSCGESQLLRRSQHASVLGCCHALHAVVSTRMLCIAASTPALA